MERSLVKIKKIDNIVPLENSDNLNIAIIGGWKIVINKNENFNIGDKVVYFEIDSFLPEEERYEFLRKYSFKMFEGNPGFRIRTIKLRGQISQGLIMPISKFPEIPEDMTIDTDLTELLNVKKYEIIKIVNGFPAGLFPSFIPKTDAERIQNISDKVLQKLDGKSFEVTQKLDGTSLTMFKNNENVSFCSRNLELKETDNVSISSHELIFRRYKEKLIEWNGFNIAIQGEIIGKEIQGNREKLATIDFYCFNIYNIDEARYLTPEEREDVIKFFEIKLVPVINKNWILRYNNNIMEDILNMADGKSIISGNLREGLVFKLNDDPDVNFKSISNKYLLKYED